jgi:LPS export ABC transporter protein LptC
MTSIGSKTARIIVLVVGCAALLTAVAVFIGFRMTAGKKGAPIAVMPQGVQMALGAINHTATQDGKTRWQLKAKAGQLQRNGSLLQLKEINLVIFLDNGQPITVEASQGALDTAANDIEVSGDVVVSNQDYTLTTSKLRYAHQRQLISTDVPVQLTDHGSRLQADAMVYDLKGSRVEFKGSVKAQMGQGPLL